MPVCCIFRSQAYGSWSIASAIQPFGYGEIIILLTGGPLSFCRFCCTNHCGNEWKSSRIQANYLSGILRLRGLRNRGRDATRRRRNHFHAVARFDRNAACSSLGLVSLAVLTIGWVRPAISISQEAGTLDSRSTLELFGDGRWRALYSYSLATHTLILTIPRMAMTHGILNAFGFVTCSLLSGPDSSSKS